MTFDPEQYKTTTRRQWHDHADGWDGWGPLLEVCETPGGFVGPCSLVVAGATR